MADLEESIFHLTKVQRAVVAAISLMMLGSVVGAFAVGQLNLPRRVSALERFDQSIVIEGVLIRQDSMEAVDREIFAEFTKIHLRLGEIICEMNSVPIQVCTFWLTQGRPTSLQRGSLGPPSTPEQ